MLEQNLPDNGAALAERESVLIEAVVKSVSANEAYVTVEVPVYTIRVEGNGFEAAPVAVPAHCIRRKFTVSDEMVERARRAYQAVPWDYRKERDVNVDAGIRAALESALND